MAKYLAKKIFVKLLSLTGVNTPFARDMWMFMARQSIVRIPWICFCSTNFKSQINFSQFANPELMFCSCDIDIHSYLWSRLLWSLSWPSQTDDCAQFLVSLSCKIATHQAAVSTVSTVARVTPSWLYKYWHYTRLVLPLPCPALHHCPDFGQFLGTTKYFNKNVRAASSISLRQHIQKMEL